jgi:hypothetical protein
MYVEVKVYHGVVTHEIFMSVFAKWEICSVGCLKTMEVKGLIMFEE